MFYIDYENLTKISVILTIEKSIKNTTYIIYQYLCSIIFTILNLFKKWKIFYYYLFTFILYFLVNQVWKLTKLLSLILMQTGLLLLHLLLIFANNLTKDITSQTEAASSLMLEESAVCF